MAEFKRLTQKESKKAMSQSIDLGINQNKVQTLAMKERLNQMKQTKLDLLCKGLVSTYNTLIGQDNQAFRSQKTIIREKKELAYLHKINQPF